MILMIQWIKDIKWGKVLIVGLIYTLISMVVRQVEAMLTLSYYMDPQYFGLWSKLMMPKAGPPPAEFMVMSLIFSMVTGVSISIIYYYLKEYLPKKRLQRMFLFADLLVATSFVFFTIPVYLLFNMPAMLLLCWFVSSFIILTATSALLVKVVK